jgi:hypothetical protein
MRPMSKQEEPAMMTTYQGSCHCGAVQFEADLDLAAGTTRCNCGFCSKARFWMTIATDDNFRLKAGADALTDYRHTPPRMPEPFLHLTFCKTCGVRPFSSGGFHPSIGSPFHAVNIACLDGLSDEELAAIPVRFVDGRHDDWEATPAVTSYL